MGAVVAGEATAAATALTMTGDGAADVMTVSEYSVSFHHK